MEERDGVDDGTAFYAVDCNCAAPAVRDFVGNKKGSLKTEKRFSGCLLHVVQMQSKQQKKGATYAVAQKT